jgi:hypothetical protein
MILRLKKGKNCVSLKVKLKYVKILKNKVKNDVVEAVQHIIFGNPEEIFETLGIDLNRLWKHKMVQRDSSNGRGSY